VNEAGIDRLARRGDTPLLLRLHSLFALVEALVKDEGSGNSVHTLNCA
jgi:hypothetical protein